MIIKFLGVGGAFSPELGNSSAIILKDNGKGLLIDCGYSVFPILKRDCYLGRIDEIFVSHSHCDHAGSLDTLLYYKKYVLNDMPQMYGNPLTFQILRDIDPLFDNNRDYLAENNNFKFFITNHYLNRINISFIYNNKIFYSGDTWQNCLTSLKLEQYNLSKIFHEVSFVDYKDNVHCYIGKLNDSHPALKAKTWLYHYNIGDYETWNDKIKGMGFAGMLQQNQIFEI